MKSQKLADPGATSAVVTVAANRWLEKKLSSDAGRCAEWLWLHKRWKTQDTPERRLRLETKRDLTPADFASLGITTFPATGDRFVIRMPNWLGDVVMALPLVRAIRAGRPDVHITLLAKKAFTPLLEATGLAQRVVALPDKGAGYWREDLGDAAGLSWIRTFSSPISTRGDLEARVMGARQRFGMVRPGKSRRLLSHAWRLPESLDEIAYAPDACLGKMAARSAWPRSSARSRAVPAGDACRRKTGGEPSRPRLRHGELPRETLAFGALEHARDAPARGAS